MMSKFVSCHFEFSCVSSFGSTHLSPYPPPLHFLGYINREDKVFISPTSVGSSHFHGILNKR